MLGFALYRRTRIAVLVVLATLAVTACGGGADGTAETETATGATTPRGDAAAGKAIFAEQGCGSCHTFAAAGSTGSIGPNLDETLERDAERTGQPLGDFVRESIVEPDAFIAPGFKAGVMPKTFGESLTSGELADLVAFLTERP